MFDNIGESMILLFYEADSLYQHGISKKTYFHFLRINVDKIFV